MGYWSGVRLHDIGLFAKSSPAWNRLDTQLNSNGRENRTERAEPRTGFAIQNSMQMSAVNICFASDFGYTECGHDVTKSSDECVIHSGVSILNNFNEILSSMISFFQPCLQVNIKICLFHFDRAIFASLRRAFSAL